MSRWMPIAGIALLGAFLVAMSLRAHESDRTIEYVIASVLTFGLCFVSAWSLLGLKAAGAFAATGIVLGWVAEQVGTTTGIIFGPYTYVDGVLGPNLGAVPIVVPLMWFSIVYVSYVLANLIVWQTPVRRGAGFGNLLVMSLLTAMLVSGYNMGADPYNQRVAQAYVAAEAGAYFGVPFKAYVGWTATAFVISFVTSFLFRAVRRPATPPSAFSMGMREPLIPFVVYASFMLFFVLRGDPEPVRLIILFTMGTPLVAALAGWRRWVQEDVSPRA